MKKLIYTLVSLVLCLGSCAEEVETQGEKTALLVKKEMHDRFVNNIVAEIVRNSGSIGYSAPNGTWSIRGQFLYLREDQLYLNFNNLTRFSFDSGVVYLYFSE